MSKPISSAGVPARAPAGTPKNRAWMAPFLSALAETSNVARAARLAGVAASTAYDARRKQREFARKWADALCEGYDNLEMELLGRLRQGEVKPAAGAKKGVRSFDNAVAIRLLMAHREAAGQEKAMRANVSAAEIRASINRKIADLRSQVEADSKAAAEGAGDAS